MHAFLVAEDFTLRTSRFTRTYRGGAMTGEIPIDRLVVDTGGESDLVRKEMERQKAASSAGTGSGSGPEAAASDPGSSDEIKKNPYVIGVPESALLAWGPFPARLGRVSSRFIGKGLHRHEEPEPLPAQLAALKARHPGRRHFRFAVVNAFGTNLGDCTIGMTAMRAVAKRLERSLDSFVIDLLLGANTGQGNFDIAGYEPWIGQVRVTGPTVQDFADYDGYFDFTGLIALPRFTELPIVDWYLWWSGLDPDMVPVHEKRNVVQLRSEALDTAQRSLATIRSPKILFNFKASVPLRSCPEESAIRIVKDLLRQNQELNIIITSKMDYKHQRLHDLTDSVKGTHLFNALIKSLDGLISVDTYSIHAADAFNIPTVGLFSSVPPEAYPYYPLHTGLLVPGGEKLPAYKKFKNTEPEWQEVKSKYTSAWNDFDANKIIRCLNEKIKEKHSANIQPPKFINKKHAISAFKMTPNGRRLVFETTSSVWAKSITRAKEMARSVIRPGSKVILVTPGQSDFPLSLADHIGSEGELHIFEPRTTRRSLIGIDLLEMSPQVPARLYETVPARYGNSKVPIEDTLTGTNPIIWGKSRKTQEIKTQPLDDQITEDVGGMFIFPPADHIAVIDYYVDIISRGKFPVVFTGLPGMTQVEQAARRLDKLKYQCWLEMIDSGDEKMISIIAIYGDVKVQAPNMKLIKIAS